MRKRGKGGQRRRVDALAGLAVLAVASKLFGRAPLPNATKTSNLAKLYSAIGAIQLGQAEYVHYVTIVHAANITRILCDHGIGQEYIPELEPRMQLIAAIDDRAQRVGRWVCSGPELEAIRWVADLHEAQINDDRATCGLLVAVENDVLRRVQAAAAAAPQGEPEHANA